MIKSKICDDLHITYPIFQGGMAWVADASLAAAVSNAGGLGLIGGMNMNALQLRDEIRLCRQKTDKPFGVNIMLMSPYVEEVSNVVIEESVPVVTTGAGNPLTYMKKWQDKGIKVIPVISSVALAKMVAKRGAYAVVAEGGESGGHIGETSTMALVREVVEAVDIPVIAAGGIADGRGLAAAFMLGAKAVQMGTAFLVANECTISETYKDLVLKAGDRDTLVTGRRLGHPARALKTPFSRAFKDKENDLDIPPEELEKFGSGALRAAVKEGDLDKGSFFCGEIAGLINERKSCKQIIEDTCREAEKLFLSAGDFVI